jgi:hypothetical protein
MATPVGPARRRGRSRRRARFPRPHRPRQWSTDRAEDRRGTPGRGARATPGRARPPGWGGVPEELRTQRLRDPRRRPLRGKRSRAGGWRRRLGARRGLPGPRPGRSETRPSRLRAMRGRLGPGRDRPGAGRGRPGVGRARAGAGRSGPPRSPRRSLAGRTPKPRRSRRPLTIPPSASLPLPSIATWDRSRRRPLHLGAGSAPIRRAAKGASDAQRGRQRPQLRCPPQLRRPRRRFLVQPLLLARTALQAQRPIRLHRRRHVRWTPRTSLPRAAPPPSAQPFRRRALQQRPRPPLGTRRSRPRIPSDRPPPGARSPLRGARLDSLLRPPSARSSRRIPLRDPPPHRPSGRTSPRRASRRPPPPPPAGWSA